MSLSIMREQLRKSGTIDLSKLRPDGRIPEGAAQKMYDLIAESDDLLSAISIYKSNEYSIPVDYFDFASFVLQNIPEGVEPTNFAQGANLGRIIEANDINAFMRLFFSTIESGKGATAEAEFAAKLAKKFAKNIVEVGFQGLTRDINSTTPQTIAKGWMAKLSNSGITPKVLASDFIDTEIRWADYLTAIINQLPDNYKSGECEIFIKPSDYEEFLKQLRMLEGGVMLAISGVVPTWMGYKIRKVPYLSKGQVLFTNPKNLLLGMVNNLRKYRDVKATARVVDTTYIMGVGYEIGIYEAAVVGE